jgi:FtsP/CotA-like multicopper oxidase with cupredoxin domain
MTISNNSLPRGLAAAVALILGTSAVQAKEVWLEAKAFTPATGALTGIPMWGYADCGASFAGCAAAAATSPGPVIIVPAGDAAGLTVHLLNSLAEPTSIYLVGQHNAPFPVNADSLRVDGRLQALTTEIAPGLDGDYSWSAADLRPGTYLYESGSHVQLQVPMGLYGAVVHDAPDASCTPAPCAYPSVPYSSSRLMLFSEVDPVLHSPATPANLTPEGYRPRILLINGVAQSSVLPAISAGADGALLRLLNAGLSNHAPQLIGGYFDVVAEDGYPAPVRRSQTATLLAASKTMDVLVATGTYGLVDRMARAGDPDSVVPPPDTTPDPFSFTDLTDVALSTLFASNTVTITGIDAPAPIGVTGGEYSVNAGPYTAASGVVSNNDTVAVQQTSSATPSTATGTTLTVGGVFDTFTVTTAAANGNPVANPDVFYILDNNNKTGTNKFVAPGVLGNDTDPETDALRVKVGSVIKTIPAGATLAVRTATDATKGEVKFHAPTLSWVGDAYFSYVASEAATAVPLDSAPAVSHVVHDQHLTSRLFHNPAGTASDRWELAGEVRELPTETAVTISWVPNTGATTAVCTHVGEVIGSVVIPVSAAPTSWVYNELMPNTADINACKRIRITVAVPEANGVPAHTSTLDQNITRVKP